MSERGSFVTEYIYCDKCLNCIKPILLKSDKFMTGTMVPHWNKEEGEFLPIIAGKIGGSYTGEEIDTFEKYLRPRIAEVICHPVRFSIIPDGSSAALLTVSPDLPTGTGD